MQGIKRIPPHVLIKPSRIREVCASLYLEDSHFTEPKTESTQKPPSSIQTSSNCLTIHISSLSASSCFTALQNTHTAPTHKHRNKPSQVMCMADLAKTCIVQWKVVIQANGADKAARRMEGWRKHGVKEEVQSQFTSTCQTRITATFLIAISYW